jgi:hypothetical protein
VTDLTRAFRFSRFALGDPRYREPYPRVLGAANSLPLTSGVMLLGGVDLAERDPVNAVTILSGTTALTMGSNGDGHLWAALYDQDLKLLGQTPDLGGAVTWPASTHKLFTFPATLYAPTTAWHYVALMVNVGTGGAPAPPTTRGINVIATPISDGAGWPANPPYRVRTLAGTAGAGLGATAPAGPLTLAAGPNVPYFVLS